MKNITTFGNKGMDLNSHTRRFMWPSQTRVKKVRVHIPNCSTITLVCTSQTAIKWRSCAHPELQYKNVRVHIPNCSTATPVCQTQRTQVKGRNWNKTVRISWRCSYTKHVFLSALCCIIKEFISSSDRSLRVTCTSSIQFKASCSEFFIYSFYQHRHLPNVFLLSLTKK